jgi:WD40 repeat protein
MGIVAFAWWRNRMAQAPEFAKPWPVRDVAFSPDGRWLAAARGYFDNENVWGGYGEISIWQVDGWKQQQSFSGPFTCKAESVALTSDSKHLVAASDKYIREASGGSPFDGNTVFVWRLQDATLVQTLNFSDEVGQGVGSVTSSALSPDGNLVALARIGGDAQVLDRTTGGRAYVLGTQSRGFAFSPDGKALASATLFKPSICLYEAASGRTLAEYDVAGIGPAVTCLRFSPDGKQIAAGCPDGSVRILSADLTKQVQAVNVSGGTYPVVAIAFGPKGDRLAVACSGGAYLVDVSSGKRLLHFAEFEYTLSATSVAFSPDGKFVAVGHGRDFEAHRAMPSGFINIWDAATGRLLKKLE